MNAPALFACPSCQRGIYNGTPSCPFCGYAPRGPVLASAAAAPPVSFSAIIGGLCTVLVVVVGLGGFFHVVSGSEGATICAKDGWAVEDTFVSVDDYAGKPLLANLHKAKVLRALFSCGVLKRPEWLDK